MKWWSQERVSSAKFLVIGAGAIGNETLKNLALLGARNVLIADFDTIEKSNLSRTVLFTKADLGRKKSEAAAEKFRQMALAPDPRVDWFHGDVVWELGTGLYREVDIVLGCLDNVETRYSINSHCWLAGKPWVDSGIHELNLHVCAYVPPNPPCYECHLSETQIHAVRQRYSCDNFKRTMFKEGKVATVQIASAIASAIQVQEAMKIICGQQTSHGKIINYMGMSNEFDLNTLSPKPDCDSHTLSYPEIVQLKLTSQVTIKEFLNEVTKREYSGERAVLDLSGSRWAFVISAVCRGCGKKIEFNRPSFRILDTETICSDCQNKKVSYESTDPSEKTVREDLAEFELGKTDERFLALSLREIGAPYWPILAVRDSQENYKYYELAGDKNILLPEMSRA